MNKKNIMVIIIAKVLISPIGAAKARTATYEFSKDEKYEAPFMVAALAEFLKVDKIIFVGTSESNWSVVYNYFNEADLNNNDNNMNIDKLNENMNIVDNYLKNKINPNSTGGSSCKLISYGRNEQELWSNFDTFIEIIEKEVSDGDQIYLDITHSFRSIPLFMYIVMEFITMLNIKDICLSGMYYGMYEASSVNGGNTPVVDLKPLFEISKWIRGIYEFTEYGNGYLISTLSKNENADISKNIEHISDNMVTNELGKLKKEMENLNKALSNDDLKNTTFLKYFRRHLTDFLNRFGNVQHNYQFQIEIAKLYFDKKKHINGYICLTESLLSGLCDIYNIPITYKNKDLMKSLMRSHRNYKCPELTDIHELYKELSVIRNNIAHADLSEVDKNIFETAEPHYEKVKEVMDITKLEKLPEKIPKDSIYNQNKRKNGN